MKRTTQKKIVQALKERIDGIVGKIAGNQQAAEREISSFFGSSQLLNNKPPTDVVLQRGLRAGLALGLWSEAEKALKERPEPTKQELERFLNEIKGADFDFMLRSSLRRMMRKLPPFPPGKQPKFKSQQRKELVSEVERVTNRIGSRKKAYIEVANKRGVHWRTIQNLCLKGRDKDSPGGTEL